MLSARHRRQRLVMRGVFAIGNGVVAAGLSTWWAGLAVAAVTMLAHAIYLRGRPGNVTSWRLGAMAERRTGRLLARLDPQGFRVLHDRALPGVPAANLDHLVIGLTGVYAVVSRRWTRGVRLWSDHRRLWAGNRPIVNVHAAVARAAHTVGESLAAELGREVAVTALVAVHGARVPREGLRFGGVLFHRARRLPDLLRAGPVVFTSAEVAEIAAAAERAFAPMLPACGRMVE